MPVARQRRYLAFERMPFTAWEIDFEHGLATIELSDGGREPSRCRGH
jgi:hypothetical protein